MVQALQPAGQCFLYIAKIITTLEGIASMARGPWDLAQLGASLACGRWQVIRALRHLAWFAQSASYFFSFFY